MFLTIFAALLVGASGRDLLEPRFQVLTPDELMIEVPRYDDLKLITFRIGVRRKNNEVEDLERGENSIDNNRIFIYDERLDLQMGDVVNYLLAFRDKEGYQAQTGKYVFDGVYFKKPLGRQLRFRRSRNPRYYIEDSGEFSPFGSHRLHRHQYGFSLFGSPQESSRNYGPPREISPNFGSSQFNQSPFSNNPFHQEASFNFGFDYNDRWQDICDKRERQRTATTTTTERPDIDIRSAIRP